MPCNNCQKIIAQVAEDSRDEEEMIKDLISCKECSEKIIAKCRSCSWPIYNYYLIHEDSGSLNVGVPFVSLTQNWKLTQCDWCYKQWQAEKKKAEKQWKQKRWTIWICQTLLIILSVFLFHKETCLAVVGLIIFLSTLISCFYFQALRPMLIDLRRHHKSRNRKPKKKEIKKLK